MSETVAYSSGQHARVIVIAPDGRTLLESEIRPARGDRFALIGDRAYIEVSNPLGHVMPSGHKPCDGFKCSGSHCGECGDSWPCPTAVSENSTVS